MGAFDSINISSSGLTAQKTWIDIISNNIANANTTRATGGMPYKRKLVVYKEREKTPFSEYLSNSKAKFNGNGVKISSIKEDDTPFKLVYEPGHPDADEDGYVKMPNVDVVSEMVDMISAYRGYESNITAMNASKSMLMKALDIGRR